MKKVLVIGPEFFGYTESVANAFIALGWSAEILNFEEPIHPFRGLNRFRYKFARDKEAIKRKNREKWQSFLKAKYIEVYPDLVFVLNGDMILQETLDFFRRGGSRVAIWMYDNIGRFPQCVQNIGHCDLFACFDESDVKNIRERGYAVHFLPQACDTDRYFKMKEVSRDIDILFVGVMWGGYDKRRLLLKHIIKRYKGSYRIEVYGVWQLASKNLFAYIFRPYKKIIHNRSISPALVNALYNRARVVINIHHEQQSSGANPKVFEICGSGAYQVCNRNSYIESIYPIGTVGLYNNESELFDLLDYALENDMSDEADEAYNIVIQSHTFIQRIKEVLDWMGIS